MKISVAQFNTRAGDLAHTSELICRYAQNAADCEADLLVLPMTVLTGQFPLDYASREGFRIDLLQALNNLSQNIACPCVVPVIINMDEDPVHEIMLVNKDGVTPLRASYYLSWRNQHSSDEEPPLFLEFSLKRTRFAVATTYEELDELVDSSEHFDAVIYLSRYGYALDDTSSALGASLAENRFRADALALDAWFVAVGPLGGYGMQTYTGASFVLAPNGDLVASAPAFEEAMLVADIFAHNTHDISASSKVTSIQKAEPMEPELYNRSLHLWETLVLGLRDNLQKRGIREAALALDGRLTSSLLAVLASDALGPTHVHVLLDHKGNQEQVAAQSLAETLRVSKAQLPDTPVVDEGFHDDLVQAHLAKLARSYDAIVLSPLDKTYLAVEASSPRCIAADLLPFGDVYRSDLIDLAHLRNTISPIIDSQAVTWFSVPAIEGLSQVEANRELQLKRVDVTIATHLEWERSWSDVVAKQGEREVTLAILQRFRSTQPAREALMPCLVVSSKPVFALRMPQGMAWQDRMRDEDERMRGKQLADSMLNAIQPAGDAQKPLHDQSDFSNLLEGLEVELKGGSLPPGMDHETVEHAVGDLLGLIQDMLEGGMQSPSIEGPFGPLTWGSPFSEN